MPTPAETEIKETVEAYTPDMPSDESGTIDESGASVDEINAAAERTQAEMEERDRVFLESLDRVLEKQRKATKEPQLEQQINRIAVGVRKKGVGVISLSLVLVIMGISMLVSLFSPAPDYLLPLRLSPLAAVLLGLEMLAYFVATKGNFRVHIPSICISAAVVVGCCVMCTVLNRSYSEQKIEYNARTIASEIYDSSYKELRYVADISTLAVDVELNGEGDRSEGIKSLGTGDHVAVSVELGGNYSSPSDFAKDCKDIIDGYRILGIPIDDFHFTNEGRLSSFGLDVEGKFAQDYSESRLAEKVSHIYIEDYDYIHDLDDFVDTTEDDTSVEASE